MATTRELIHAAAVLVESSWEMDAAEFDARLSAFVDSANDKIGALRVVCRAAEGRAASLKAEAAAYTAAAKTHERTAALAKQRALDLLAAAEAAGEVLPGVRRQPNGGAVPLVYAPDFALERLPMSLWRVTTEPDAEKIRALLESGEELRGVTLGTRGSHLRWTESA